MVLEEVKFLQKQRERKTGIPAFSTASTDAGALHVIKSGGRGGEGGGEEKEEQVLQDTFAQETAVTIEDPNMYASSLSSLSLTAVELVNFSGFQ
jgi:hypothetical protein